MSILSSLGLSKNTPPGATLSSAYEGLHLASDKLRGILTAGIARNETALKQELGRTLRATDLSGIQMGVTFDGEQSIAVGITHTDGKKEFIRRGPENERLFAIIDRIKQEESTGRAITAIKTTAKVIGNVIKLAFYASLADYAAYTISKLQGHTEAEAPKAEQSKPSSESPRDQADTGTNTQEALHKALNDKSRENAQLTSRLQAAEAQNTQDASTIQSLEASQQQLTSNLESTTQELQTARAQNTLDASTIQRLEASQQEFSSNLESTTQELQAARAQNTLDASTIQRLEASQQQLTSNLESTTQELQTARAQNTQDASKIESLEASQQELTSNLETVTEDLQTARTQNSQDASTIQRLEDSQEQLTSNLESVTEELQTARAQNSQDASTIQRLEETLEEIESITETTVQRLQNQLREAQERLFYSDTSNTALQEELESQQISSSTTVEMLKEQIEEQSAQIQALTEHFDSTVGHIVRYGSPDVEHTGTFPLSLLEIEQPKETSEIPPPPVSSATFELDSQGRLITDSYYYPSYTSQGEYNALNTPSIDGHLFPDTSSSIPSPSVIGAVALTTAAIFGGRRLWSWMKGKDNSRNTPIKRRQSNSSRPPSEEAIDALTSLTTPSSSSSTSLSSSPTNQLQNASRIQEDFQTLQASLIQNQNELRTLQTRYAALQKEHQASQEKLSTQEATSASRSQEQQERLTALSEQLRAQEQTNAQLKEQFTLLSTQKQQELDAYKDQVRAKMEKLNSTIYKYKKELAKSEAEKQESEHNSKFCMIRLAGQDGTISQLEEEIATLKTEYEKLKVEHEEYTKNVKFLSQLSIDKNRKQTSDLRAQKREIDRLASEFEASISQSEEQIALQKELIDIQEVQLGDARRSQLLTQEKLANLEKQSKETIEGLSAQLASQKLKEKRDLIQELADRVEATKPFVSLEGPIDSLDVSTIEQADALIQALQKRLESNERGLDTQRDQIKALENELNRLYKEIWDHITDYRGEIWPHFAAGRPTVERSCVRSKEEAMQRRMFLRREIEKLIELKESRLYKDNTDEGLQLAVDDAELEKMGELQDLYHAGVRLTEEELEIIGEEPVAGIDDVGPLAPRPSAKEITEAGEWALEEIELGQFEDSDDEYSVLDTRDCVLRPTSSILDQRRSQLDDSRSEINLAKTILKI